MSLTSQVVLLATRIGQEIKSVHDSLNIHTANTANPHNTTKAQVGLSNVENSVPKSVLLGIATPTVIPGVVNTVVETALFSFTVPATQVASGDLLIVEYALDLKNNSGTTQGMTLRFKLGATTIMSYAPSWATNANRIKSNGHVKITLAALNDQRCSAQYLSTAPTINPMTVLTAANSGIGVADATEDLTTDKIFTMTVQLDAAHANLDARLHSATLWRTRA